MLSVVTPEHMRAIDEAATDPVEVLIERAGAAVARSAVELLGGTYGRTAIVLAGPGDNGADGRVAAARLRQRGVSVRVIDALDAPAALPAVDLVIDAAFGTGFRDEWRAPAVGDARVLAVDVPTGLDALTGEVRPGTLPADVTVTFAAAKPGHVLGAGSTVTGRLRVADIGLSIDAPDAGIVESTDVAGWLPGRAPDAHKWHHAVRVVAGSLGMTGAASLVAAAAQRAGAGLVVLSVPGLDADAPVEVVGRRIPPFDWVGAVLDDLERFHALVIGPGLGRERHTLPSIVTAVVDSVVPVVVDGDALFAMSWNEEGTPAFLRDREVATVLTPHDGEYALLTGHRPGPDRLAAARALVDMTGATVLLKGPTTIVAGRGETPLFVTNGDQRLATAGSGDVLAGIVGSLLAQGVSPFRAAAGAAWIHAAAGAELRAHGLVASDLLGALPTVLERCRPDTPPR